MPRSRNSRSSSPLKSLKTTTGQSEYDRIFQNVQEMFYDTVDADVIYFVLTECHWRSEEAIDNLLTIVEKSEAQPIKTKSKLQEIAEDVLGPLRHDDCHEQGHTHPGSSQVSAETGATSQEESNLLFQSSSSPSLIDLQARGGIDQQVTNASSPRIEKGLNPVSTDAVLEWDFPRLSKDSPKVVKLDSVKQQRIKSEELKNESWRAIKAPIARKSSNSPHQILENEYSSTKTGLTSAGQVKDGVSPSRPRLEMNRSFPVRLLSKSPDEIHEKLSFPQPLHQSSSESVLAKNNIKVDVAQPESFELDDTVISCLSEINHELLDETEKKTDKRLYRRSRSSSIRSQTSENESGGTGCSTPDPSHMRTSTPNNQPMTLPVIGLSVEAPEFVPRPKKTKTEEVAQSSSEAVAVTASAISSRPSSAPLKVETKSIPVPVSSPHQGISPVIRLGSPRLAVVSPGSAISPPTNVSVPNSAQLTGSPMFITPKWQPVFPGMYSPQQPPPPLQPRIVPQQIPQQIPQPLPQHLPPNYRFSPPGTQFPPYSGVMYPVGARPIFRVAGLPPRLPQVPVPQGVQVVKEVNDNMVAMATGQPIMVTREAVHHGHFHAGLEGMKSKSGDLQQSLDVCVETVRALSKAGKKVMVIVRGLPGSGKSTLARAIQFDGVVLSTDDYFMKGDMYEYDPDKLTEGHQWNRERAKEAIRLGTSPIVIDNTNTQKWEFKPYISMALNNNYHVEIMEPDTPWKFKPKELAKRTVHGVPEDQIERMLNRYEKNLTVAIVTNKTKKPVANGLSDSQIKYNSSSKENSLSPALERKPVKAAKSEATRRSRSRGKSNKLRDLKSTRKIQNKVSNSPGLGNSNVNELQEWQISEDDKMWDRQTLSPNSVHPFESNNTSLLDDWTTDDWNEVRMETTEDGISNNDDTVQNPSLIIPNSDLANITSSQHETNFYPLPSGISSMTSSKTASPIIEFNVLETYNQSNHNSDSNLASKLEEKTVCYTERKILKEIEAELSEEVLGYVNEVMEEQSNMNPNDLSVENRNRIEEELKALLQFYPIEDEEQRRKAEILIGLKLKNTENEQECYIIETGVAEETCYEQYYVGENGGIYMSSKQTAMYDENIVSQGAEGNDDSKDIISLMQDSNTDRTVDVNLDLDNSLNKEVANILNGFNLDLKDKSMGKFEHATLETTMNDHVVDSLIEVENEDNITKHDNHPVQERENKISDVSSKYNLEVNEDTDKITEKADNISVLVEEEFQNIHQPQEFHNSLESVSSKNQTQASIYDIDSAVIRAETSDFVETDSLFENDSAIIAASMDSLEKDKDSLYNNDSAILAVSTEAVDTDSLYETDSAIIAASTDIGDTDIVVDDADVMKRLKATVEELKYWGQIEIEETEASAETVTTEWDDYSQEIDDQWHNELSSMSVKAKPQRKKRHNNGSYNGMENGSSKLDANAKLLRNQFNETEEIFIDDNNKETLNNTTHLATGLIEASKSMNGSHSVELINQYESENVVFSQSCYNNNNEISSNTSPSISAAGYENNENLNLTNDLVPAQYADKGEMVDFIENQNTEVKNTSGNESEQPVQTSETDQDNSIFISDEEELLDGSPLSKANSEEPKTENSDDMIFVSDDDMECLNTDLTVDGLQTVAIQEEVTADITDRSESLNIEHGSVITNNGQESLIEVKTVLPDLNPPSKDSIVEEKETLFNENCRFEAGFSYEKVSQTIDKSTVLTSSAGLTVNDMHKNVENTAAYSQPCHVVNVTEKETSDLKLSEISSGYSVQNQPSPKKRKQSKSRLAAKLSKPFFDFADTEKFASNDWSTFSSPFDSNTVTKLSKKDKIVERTDLKSVGTLTESGDFRVLNVYSSGEDIDYVHKYTLVKTRSRSIDMDNEQLAKCSVEIEKTSIRKMDKSTLTDDLEKGDDNENIQFLKTCFPNISEDELESVLLNCANNTEWALNLLLDWKYHLHYTDEEKEHFAREVSKCARCPSPEMSDKNNDSLIESNPDSLLNLCFEKIEKENIAGREDLEKQLIQTGKERLDRIEDENITKIRMRRSTSLSESSFDTNRSGISASHSFEKVRRSISEPYQNLDSAFLSPASVFDEKEYLLKGLQTSPGSLAHKISLKQHKVFGASAAVEEKNSGDEWICNNIDELSKSGTVIAKDTVTDTESGKTDKSQIHIDTEIITGTSSSNDIAREEERLINHVQENDISITEEERLSSTPEPIASSSVENLVVFSLSLDSSVITQLEHLFGPAGDNSLTGHGDLEVPINFETARLLHQCVRNGLQDAGHAKYKQLKEDEEFARRLQEEQDLSDRRNENQTYQSPSKRFANARRGHAVSFANTPPPIRREPVKPLTEIMEEEMTKQTAREELQKFLESEGGHAAIATRMKRQKLHESFPTIDTTLLDQIFQANCYNLSETMETIQSSLSYQPVQTVMTREMEEKYDRQLIQSIKQQSTLDVLDSFNSLSEDYEDVVDAEYQDYRGEATLQHKLRQECFAKAQAAYRKGMKQLASFYSQQGHLHTQKLKEANMRASEQILEDRHNDLETKMTLDLHGLHVDEAIAALDRILPEKERERYKSHLIIITGRGRHSNHGIPRLRPAVLAYLQRHQYRCAPSSELLQRGNLEERLQLGIIEMKGHKLIESIEE